MDTTAILVFGALGGLIPDAIRLLKYKYKNKLPAYLSSPAFWMGIVIQVILGAFTAWLLSAANPIQGLACGFSAPEILTRILAKQASEQDRATGEFDLLTWWAG